MAGSSSGLIRWLLLAVVLGGHALALDWLARHLDAAPVLRTMAPALYTRLLQPAAPPEVPSRPATVPAPAPAPARTLARAVPPRPAASQPARPAEPPPSQRPSTTNPGAPADDAGPEPQATAAAETVGRQEPAAAPESPAPAERPDPSPPRALEPEAAPNVAAEPAQPAASAAAAPDSWPSNTRLSYRLGGRFRSGDLYGDARVQWQRDGDRYQVRVDIDITLWATLVMTSQGIVTPEGLQPRAYEEQTSRKRRAAQFGETTLALEKGRSLPRPAGMQDTASQFVELAHRFATGKEALEVGRSISFWMARPGDVDRWTYDIVGRELLQTPHLGMVEAFHLKPRPIDKPRGKITAEMWFAPSLQYLPVRIKVRMGDEAEVDLMVDRIEQ